MNATRIEELLTKLDGSGTDREWAAVEELRTLGEALPTALLGRFRASRSWKIRCSCVYHAIRYARVSEEAVALGLEAIRDRAKGVRYRGAMLLAYAQRDDVLPELREALERLGDDPSGADLAAAIDALANKNHNYFVDRAHNGKATLTIG